MSGQAWTRSGLGTLPGTVPGTGADFEQNALNYGLIVQAICCYSYVEIGNGFWARNLELEVELLEGRRGGRLAMELQDEAIIASNLSLISVG